MVSRRELGHAHNWLTREGLEEGGGDGDVPEDAKVRGPPREAECGDGQGLAGRDVLKVRGHRVDGTRPSAAHEERVGAVRQDGGARAVDVGGHGGSQVTHTHTHTHTTHTHTTYTHTYTTHNWKHNYSNYKAKVVRIERKPCFEVGDHDGTLVDANDQVGWHSLLSTLQL